VRHPLYTAGLIFIWLIPIMSSNLLALNVGITLYLYIGSIFEERKLLAEWGDEYRTYQRKVPRLIPLPWKHA
jgi:protein-S-isoprenylcysteine O-methyltransferase Ste14